LKINNIKSCKQIAIVWYWIEWKANYKFLQDINFLWNIEIFKNDRNLRNLKKFDLIIKSPWISKHKNIEILKLQKLWRISSSTDIFLNNAKWKFIAITWTKWKSTCSSILYSILKSKYWDNIKLIWNIWHPAISEILSSNTNDIFVFELSSYQIEDLKWKYFDLGLLINIFPDHLDYHLWFDNYKKAKKNIFNISKKVIYKNKGNFLNKENNKDRAIEVNQIDKTKIKAKGDHNISNMQFAIIAAKSFWIDLNQCLKVIYDFKPLKYRLEEIDIWNKIWVNDSISTTPESTLAWIKVYEDVLEWIILWWKDRWYDFNNLIDYLSSLDTLKAIVLLPENNKKILNIINKVFKRKIDIFESSNMKDIIEFLDTKCWIKSAILLSTASPSYNLYENYIKQWEDFIKNIKIHFNLLKNV